MKDFPFDELEGILSPEVIERLKQEADNAERQGDPNENQRIS
ncbi:hypothetical protein ACQKNX_02290 [Lysinibacillus sp. NPDC093712]